MKVPYVELQVSDPDERGRLLAAVDGVLQSGQYILGDTVADCEDAFAQVAGGAHAVGVNSGTDAIVLALMALGVGAGDEVITQPNSFLASASAILLAGATPRFADVGDDFMLDVDAVRAAIGPKTKAILAVHLTGMPADMDALMALADEHGLYLIEDAAQAVGARYRGRPVGALGHAGCFSLHPLKNISACGDGGVLTTNDAALAERVKLLRNHGLETRDDWAALGLNSRLDAVQAAIVTERLRGLDNVNDQRRENAARYRVHLDGLVTLPPGDEDHVHAVYHTFVVRTDQRDALRDHLNANGIGCGIHYPIPLHLQPAVKNLGYTRGDFPVAEEQAATILSLPVFPNLGEERQMMVIDAVRGFFA